MLDELSASDAERLQSVYSSSHRLSSLTDDQQQQLIEDLSIDVRTTVVCFNLFTRLNPV